MRFSKALVLCTTASFAAAGPAGSAGVVVDLSVEPVPTIAGAGADEQFGYSGGCGDLDGDGATELVIGAPGCASKGTGERAGAVYVFSLSAVASADSGAQASDAATAVISGDTPDERFGTTLLVARLDSDAHPDLVVGAPSWGPGEQVATGRAYVFFGPLDLSRDIAASGADVVMEGEAPGDHFGSALAAGDLDGDGENELLVAAFLAGAPEAQGAGTVYAVRGRDLREAGPRELVSGIARASVRGRQRGDALGGLLVIPGEPVRVALGSYQADGPGPGDVDIGSVAVVDGDVLMSALGRPVSEVASCTMLGPRPRGFLGRAMSSGDVDGDGVQDILVSAYASRGDNSKADASGEAFIVFGAQDGFPDTVDLADALVPRFRGRERWDLFGLPVLLADLDGDGSAEVTVAAQFADSRDGTRSRCGEVYIYRGGLRSVIAAKAVSPDQADLTFVGARSLDSLGGFLLTAPAEARFPGLVIGAPDASGPGAARSGKVHIVDPELLSRR